MARAGEIAGLTTAGSTVFDWSTDGDATGFTVIVASGGNNCEVQVAPMHGASWFTVPAGATQTFTARPGAITSVTLRSDTGTVNVGYGVTETDSYG